MAILVVACSLALPALLVLLWVRAKSNGEEPSHRVNQVAWIASSVIGGSVALSSLQPWFAAVWSLIDLSSTGWLLFASLGAFMGLTMYVVMRVALFGVATACHRWSCRLPPEYADSVRHRLLMELYVLLGFAAAGVVALLLGYAVITFDIPTWSVLPLAVAVLPFYQTFGLPWLQYLRAPRLTTRNVAEVEAWLETLRSARALPRFHVRVQEGHLANAFATAGLRAHLLVIGGRLLDGMSNTELRAVLAHELAHIEKGHVPRLVLPLIIVGLTLHVLSITWFVRPLFATDEVPYLIAGATLAGVFGGIYLVALPGVFMRRMEFQADRLATEILGEAEPLINALTKLAELNRQPLSAKSWSHPSIQARIDAIRHPTPA